MPAAFDAMVKPRAAEPLGVGIDNKQHILAGAVLIEVRGDKHRFELEGKADAVFNEALHLHGQVKTRGSIHHPPPQFVGSNRPRPRGAPLRIVDCRQQPRIAVTDFGLHSLQGQVGRAREIVSGVPEVKVRQFNLAAVDAPLLAGQGNLAEIEQRRVGGQRDAQHHKSHGHIDPGQAVGPRIAPSRDAEHVAE